MVFKKSRERDSNPRPGAYEAPALPTELSRLRILPSQLSLILPELLKKKKPVIRFFPGICLRELHQRL